MKRIFSKRARTHGNVYKNNVVNGTIGCDSGSYNRFFANNILGGGISSDGTSVHNLIYGNTVKDGRGIWACYNDVVARNTVTSSEQGISIGWGFNSIICGNIITSNLGAGLTKLEGTNNTFYANYVANNSVAALVGTKVLSHSGNNTFYHNNFINNIQQTQILNLDHMDYWDNGEEGNFWSNYTGSDANHNGLGDSPYVIFGERHTQDYPYIYAESYEDHYPLMTPFNCSGAKIELPGWAGTQFPRPSFPTTLVAAIVIVVCVFGFGFIVDFLKAKSNRQRTGEKVR